MRDNAHIVSFDAARRAHSASPQGQRPSAHSQRGASSSAGVRPAITTASRSSFGGFSPFRSGKSPRPGNTRPAARSSARPAANDRRLVSKTLSEVWDDRIDYQEDDPEGAPQQEAGALSSMRSRLNARKRAFTKARADRKFYKQYESGTPAVPGEGGPRAAVYKGEMGSIHKRASHMQGPNPTMPSLKRRQGFASSGKRWYESKKFMIPCAVAVCLAFTCVFLYEPAQQLYTASREYDRLLVEYHALAERQDDIADKVAYLQTDAGIEDAARQSYGWVRDGEYSVNVTGRKTDDSPAVTGDILSKDIDFPETWYSGVLDPFFGVGS